MVEIGEFEFQITSALVMSVGNLAQNEFVMRSSNYEVPVDFAPVDKPACHYLADVPCGECIPMFTGS